ncbi:MAG: carboxymuconolactone decarboxylase family protein [Rubripirellula sp.]
MSRIPTIDPKQATGEAQALLSGVQAKLGMTPNLMRVMANSPVVLDAYLKFSASLGRGDLPAKTRELIALAVAQESACEYCLSAHSAIGRTVGLTPDQVRDARFGSAVDSKSDGILKLATQIVKKRGWVSDAALTAARDAGVTDAEIAEVVANTSLNLFTNYFNHVAETEIDFPVAEKLETGVPVDSNTIS